MRKFKLYQPISQGKVLHDGTHWIQLRIDTLQKEPLFGYWAKNNSLKYWYLCLKYSWRRWLNKGLIYRQLNALEKIKEVK